MLFSCFVSIHEIRGLTYLFCCLLAYCDGDESYFNHSLQDLLKEENEHCQEVALLALYALSPNIEIQTDQLAGQTILEFLGTTQPEKLRDAAVRLLDLMVEKNAVNAKNFMETPGALKNTLATLKIWLDESPECPESASCQNCASALLKMATEDGNDSVRLGILNADLNTLIKYVQKCENVKLKELLTTMLNLTCKNGKGSDQVHRALVEVISDYPANIMILISSDKYYLGFFINVHKFISLDSTLSLETILD